ncbi:MAG: hypothetical protein DRG27_00850 [Deltaproteobacteria bacterium]|nr:MAG: hypothetical protein DRG27_00850 [Deltaproteobacteria bacterium]
MYLYNQHHIKPLFVDFFPWKQKEEEDQNKINIEEIKKEAYLQGLKEGIEKGRIEAEKEAQQQIKKIKEEYEKEKKQIILNAASKLTQITEQISSLREEIINKSEEDILKIALMIAKKVIKAEVSQGTEALLNNIKEALSNTIEKDKVIVRVHPEDYEKLKSIETLKEVLDVDELVLQKDESISIPGGCIVETRFSEIDARIETQLKAIEKLFLGNGR